MRRAQMDISRTTVTEIYESARTKIADSLIGGKTLVIAGGRYRLCDGTGPLCCHRCGRSAPRKFHKRRKKKREIISGDGSSEENGISPSPFRAHGVVGGKKEKGKIGRRRGSEHNRGGGAPFAGFLTAHQVDALICGGIGGGAQTALAQAGIRLYGGVSGSADEAAAALAAGQLTFDPNVHCTHHEHEHSCGHHTTANTAAESTNAKGTLG